MEKRELDEDDSDSDEELLDKKRARKESPGTPKGGEEAHSAGMAMQDAFVSQVANRMEYGETPLGGVK